MAVYDDIIAALSAQGTPADSAMQAWITNSLAAYGGSNYYVFKNPTDRIQLDLRSSSTAYINWGDGTTDSVNSPSTTVNKYKNYGSTANRGVVLIGNVTRLVSNYTDGRSNFSGSIATNTSPTYLYITGSNTVSGSIAGLTSLTVLYITGSNTVSGSIAGLTSLTFLNIGGLNTVTYNTTSGRSWSNNMRRVYILPGSSGVFTSQMVDALLIDLSGVSTWITEKEVDLRGNCGGPTYASTSAIATIQGKGVTVNTNSQYVDPTIMQFFGVTDMTGILGQPTWVTYKAIDSTGAPKTGDKANHTIKIAKNGSEATATNSGHVSNHHELSGGEYEILLTAAECDSLSVAVHGTSSTSGVKLSSVSIGLIAGDSSGRVTVGAVKDSIAVNDPHVYDLFLDSSTGYPITVVSSYASADGLIRYVNNAVVGDLPIATYVGVSDEVYTAAHVFNQAIPDEEGWKFATYSQVDNFDLSGVTVFPIQASMTMPTGAITGGSSFAIRVFQNSSTDVTVSAVDANGDAITLTGKTVNLVVYDSNGSISKTAASSISGSTATFTIGSPITDDKGIWSYNVWNDTDHILLLQGQFEVKYAPDGSDLGA